MIRLLNAGQIGSYLSWSVVLSCTETIFCSDNNFASALSIRSSKEIISVDRFPKSLCANIYAIQSFVCMYLCIYKLRNKKKNTLTPLTLTLPPLHPKEPKKKTQQQKLNRKIKICVN